MLLPLFHRAGSQWHKHQRPYQKLHQSKNNQFRSSLSSVVETNCQEAGFINWLECKKAFLILTSMNQFAVSKCSKAARVLPNVWNGAHGSAPKHKNYFPKQKNYCGLSPSHE
jgi:hypothetical protein